MKKNKQFYFVEMTDTFGGEANYSWVNRFKVEATSMKHALTKAKQEVYHSPLPKHELHNYGDSMAAYLKSNCVVFFISGWDDENHKHYSNIKEL